MLVHFIGAVVGGMKFHVGESATRNNTPNTKDNNELMHLQFSLSANVLHSFLVSRKFVNRTIPYQLLLLLSMIRIDSVLCCHIVTYKCYNNAALFMQFDRFSLSLG